MMLFGFLGGLRYALYKFRKPVDHISVDLDILVHVDDVLGGCG